MGAVKLFKWTLNHPITVASFVASCFIPYAFHRLGLLKEGLIENPNSTYELLRIGSPLLAFNAVELFLFFLRGYTSVSLKQPKLKFQLNYYRRVRTIEDTLKKQKPPEIKSCSSISFSTFSVDDLYIAVDLFNDSTSFISSAALRRKSSLLFTQAATDLFGHERYDEGMDFVRRAVDLSQSRQQGTRSVFQSLYLLNVRFAAFLCRKLVPHDITMYMFSSAYAALTNPQKAWYFAQLGKRVADEFNSPFRKEMYVFDALLASAQGRSDEEQSWKEAIELVRDEPMERLGESRTIVRRIANSPFFANTFIFKERESLEALLKERKNYEQLAELIDAAVPKPLYVTQEPENSLHYLVLRYLPGETLQAKLEKGDKSAMPEVIRTLVQIHARFRSSLPAINIREKLEDRLVEFGPIRSQIRTNYAPIIASFDQIPLVWNKDAHPENWQIGEKVGVLDCEGDCLIPATFDLANLLEYDNFFTQEEKKAYITVYALELTKEGIPVQNYLCAYYNSVIHRMICFASAWSSPDRASMHPKRNGAIQRAITAIDSIETNCKPYFDRFAEEYRQLANALHKIKESLDTGQPPS